MMPRQKIFPLALLALLLLLPGCPQNGEQTDQKQSGKNWDRQAAEKEYRQIEAELNLARMVKPYMVLDFQKREVMIKLKGVEVWNYPMETVDGDYSALVSFSKKFQGSEHLLVRPVTEKHLFASSEKTSDSILAIVGKAVNVDPLLLQRQVPQRFQILWNHNLVLDIRTDVAGRPESRFKNTMAEFRRALQLPFGEAYLVLKMDPDRALTLYRASEPGLPTLIIPAP